MAAAGIGTRNTAGVLGAGPPENVVKLSLETMEILRKAGADVNARISDVTSLTARIARTNTMTDRQGQTTLFLAVESGRTEVVRYLLDHGARVDVKDDMGKTADRCGRSGGAGRRDAGPHPGDRRPAQTARKIRETNCEYRNLGIVSARRPGDKPGAAVPAAVPKNGGAHDEHSLVCKIAVGRRPGHHRGRVAA